MRSQLLRILVRASLVALSVSAQGREAGDRLQIAVLVYNHAGVEPATLLAAEAAASEVYEKAEVAIAWKNCPEETAADRCVPTADLDQFVLNIARPSRVVPPGTFGLAFSGRDGFGKVCNVFYDRILDLHRHFPSAAEATILGIMTAHELGHLLLGSNSHSATGVMQAVWHYQDFIPATFGVITFDRKQVHKIHDRLKQITLMERATQ